MQALDKLIAGIPQSIENPEILLGLSSWHLYPDMVIIHDKAKPVNQEDRLVAPGGIMTIGLRGPWQKDAQGILWSVPLSHLRYYGKPVSSKRELGICTSRITFEQLLFLCLGSLTRGWHAKPGKVAQFFCALSGIWHKEGEIMPAWMRLFFETVQWYESLEGKEKESADQIFFLGRRRCETLFDSSARPIPEAFGLCNIGNFVKALCCAENRISWLRTFLTSPTNIMKVPSGAVIRYYPNKEDNICKGSHPSQAADRIEPREGAQVNTETVNDHNQEVEVPECGIPNHESHPDKQTPCVSVEFASVYPVAVGGKPKSYKRWIPANESLWSPCKERGHRVIRDNECPWQIEGFESPCTASVRRMKAMCRKTTEDAGLYHSSWYFGALCHSMPFTTESTYEDRLIIPALVSIQPVTLGQMTSKSLVLLDGQELCSHCGKAFSVQRDKPAHLTKKRKLSYERGCRSKWYMPTVDFFIGDGKPRTWSAHPVLGDKNVAAVCLPPSHDAPQKKWLPQIIDIDSVISYLEAGIFSVASLSKYLAEPEEEFWMFPTNSILKSFQTLLAASALYRDLPDSTVSIEVTTKCLGDAKWARESATASALMKNFSCIALFEGGLDIDPAELEDVLAISSGNSLHIAAFCLQDPWHEAKPGRILHTIGNVGKPGMCFLISPKEPLVHEPERDKWQLVRHAPFDGQFESNLTNTSLHLSFTGYEFPVRTTDHGAFDKQAFFIEAAVRAFDRREWVADLDLNAAFNAKYRCSQKMQTLHTRFDFGRMGEPLQDPLGASLVGRLAPCNHSDHEQSEYSRLELTSVDSWVEFLDAPTTEFIVRAKDDWLSRLAVFAVAMQIGRPVVIASDHVCWRCAEEMAEKLRPGTFNKDHWTNTGSGRPALMVLC
jgi:hypothetical protein